MTPNDEISIGPHDPQPVATTARITDVDQFFRAFQWIEAKTRNVALEELPEPLRMIRVLLHLAMELESNGIAYFLTESQEQVGVYAVDAERFCREIGATRTAEYLARAGALFPGGRVPATLREIIVAEAALVRLVPRPLSVLDREYPDARAELAGALRAWLEANREAVETLIVQTIPPAVAPPKRRSARKGKKASPFAGSPLARILALADPDPAAQRYKRGEALLEWTWEGVPGRKVIPFDELPETARMIVVLDQLRAAFSSSGLSDVVEWDVGDNLTEAIGWLRKIGATRTVEYLRAFARLFPRGQVPKTVRARTAALERIEASHPSDRLDQLDREYRVDAADEIIDALCEWLSRNVVAVERDLSSMARPRRGASPDDFFAKEGDRLAFCTRIMESRERLIAEGRTDQIAPPAVQLGDIVELSTPNGVAYLQVTHDHAFAAAVGPVVRVLPGTFPSRLADAELRRLVDGETLFHTLFNVDEQLYRGAVAIVGRMDVPVDARAMPTFLFLAGKTRDGRNVWGTWDGGHEASGRITGPLLPAQRRMPVLPISLSAEQLATQLVDGWSPAAEYASWGEGRSR